MGNCWPTRHRSDPKTAIQEVIWNSPDVTELHVLNKPTLSKKRLYRLFKGLRTNTNLKELSLVNIGLDDDLARLLAEHLRDNSTLTVLDLGDNRLTYWGVLGILQAISPTVEELFFGRQPEGVLTIEDQEEIAKTVTGSTGLLKLCLRMNHQDSIRVVLLHLQTNGMTLPYPEDDDDTDTAVFLGPHEASACYMDRGKAFFLGKLPRHQFF